MAKLPKLTRLCPSIEENIHRALRVESEKPSERDNVLSMSQIGGCEKALRLDLHGSGKGNEFSGQTLAIFSLGHAIEAEVVKLLKLAGYEVSELDPDGNQHTFTALDGAMVGHADGFITKDGRRYLLEIKSASRNSFSRLLKSNSYESWNSRYGDQLQAYMGHSGVHDSLAIVYCKDDSSMRQEKIRFRPDRFAELMEKAERVLESETVMDRPADARSQFCKLCKYCDYNAECWSPLAGVSLR